MDIYEVIYLKRYWYSGNYDEKKNYVITKNSPFPRKDNIKGVMYFEKKIFFEMSRKIG